MKDRRVIITIDSILRIFADYLPEEDFPGDVKAVKLMVRPSDRKLAIVASSDTWTEGQAPISVNFKLRRIWGNK